MMPAMSEHPFRKSLATAASEGPLLGPHAPGPGGVHDYRRAEIYGSDGWMEGLINRPGAPRVSRTYTVTLEEVAAGRQPVCWSQTDHVRADGLTAMSEAVLSVMRHAWRDTLLTEWELCDLLGVPFPGRRPTPGEQMPHHRDATRRRAARRKWRR